MSTPAVILAAVLGAVLLVPIVWLVAVYNRLVRLRNACDESWSQIDTELLRRYELVPSIVETLRAYAAHERATLEAVVAARRRAESNHGDPESQARDENQLIGELRRLFVLAEAYPELKSDRGFLKLQRELSLTEDRIARARRFYNSNVRDLNIQIEAVPSNLVASSFGFASRQYFEIEDHVRAAPAVSLGLGGGV